MTGRVTLFRSRLKADVAEPYGRDAGQMYELAQQMPGFVSAQDFVADDGERLAVIEFDSAANLRAWRVEPQHAAMQQRGRDAYYSAYTLQVCEVVRESRFDAAAAARTGWSRDPAHARAVAERWLVCFEARDLDGLLALYADDATHTSPKIRARHPDTGGLLRGKPELHAWWADSFERLPALRYVPTSITADADRAVVEYTRELPGEPSLPIAEMFELGAHDGPNAGLIVASRVFHG